MKHVEERLQVPWNERGIWNAEWRAVWCGSIWETKAFLTSARVRLSSRRERSEARRGLRRREGLRREPRRPTRGDNVFKFHESQLSLRPLGPRAAARRRTRRERGGENSRGVYTAFELCKMKNSYRFNTVQDMTVMIILTLCLWLNIFWKCTKIKQTFWLSYRAVWQV